MSGFDTNQVKEQSSYSFDEEAPKFWMFFRIGAAAFVSLTALYLTFEWLFPGETGLAAVVSGLAAAVSLVWAFLNRKTEYWDEFREHVAEYRSQGRIVWYMPLVMISPVPLLYIAAPREIQPGVVALSLADHIAAGSVIVFAINISAPPGMMHNLVFNVLALALFFAVFVIQWSIPYVIQKLFLQ